MCLTPTVIVILNCLQYILIRDYVVLLISPWLKKQRMNFDFVILASFKKSEGFDFGRNRYYSATLALVLIE